MNETAYVAGSRRAWLSMLQECMRQLGRDTPEFQQARLVAEREEAILALRLICEEHGDNDWLDDLHLADIIAKHLAPHLPEPTPR
jgi:hypothetical protein